MIVVQDSYESMYYKNICVPSWEKHGYQVSFIPAKNWEQTDKFIKFDSQRIRFYETGKRDFYKTEQLSVYSHHEAWKKVISTNVPSIIIEHDCFLNYDLPGWVEEKQMWCFAAGHMFDPKLDVNNPEYLRKYNTSPMRLKGSTGYYLKPEAARALRYYYKNNFIQRDLPEQLIEIAVDRQYMPISEVSKYNSHGHNIAYAVELYDPEIGKTVKDGKKIS